MEKMFEFVEDPVECEDIVTKAGKTYVKSDTYCIEVVEIPIHLKDISIRFYRCVDMLSGKIDYEISETDKKTNKEKWYFSFPDVDFQVDEEDEIAGETE